MNEEEQNTDIRKKLLNLPRLKASADFENNLLRLINTSEPEHFKTEPVMKKPGILDFLFGKKTLIWAVPAGSLAVILIVFFLIVRNDSVKESATNQKTEITGLNEEQKSPSVDGTIKQSEIPGKDIANDLEIGRNTPSEKEKTIQKGYQETAPGIKTEQPSLNTGREKTETKEAKDEIIIKDAVKPETPKKNEVMETVPPKPTDKGRIEEAKPKKEEGYDAIRKEEKVKEESEKAPVIDKKLVAPLIKDSDKKKTGKDSTKKDESKTKQKELSKELLEELKKKIKDN
ncbi:MAG: hypothetical protein MUE56_00755 [Ignavibacteria bacterium]|nr:hypothetical protein [Ignavibacteria bacterium]